MNEHIKMISIFYSYKRLYGMIRVEISVF